MKSKEDENNSENKQKNNPKYSKKRKKPEISKIYRVDRMIICISRRYHNMQLKGSKD